jgi:hypothetical protein
MLTQRYRLMQERQDRRAALAAMILVNVHRDSEHRAIPFDLEEVVSWLGHGFQRTPSVPASVQPSVETLAERMHHLAAIYNGQAHDH